MNTNAELQKVVAFLGRDHADPAGACRLAALQLTVLLKRRRFRRKMDRALLNAVEAAEGRRA